MLDTGFQGPLVTQLISRPWDVPLCPQPHPRRGAQDCFPRGCPNHSPVANLPGRDRAGDHTRSFCCTNAANPHHRDEPGWKGPGSRASRPEWGTGGWGVEPQPSCMRTRSCWEGVSRAQPGLCPAPSPSQPGCPNCPQECLLSWPSRSTPPSPGLGVLDHSGDLSGHFAAPPHRSRSHAQGGMEVARIRALVLHRCGLGLSGGDGWMGSRTPTVLYEDEVVLGGGFPGPARLMPRSLTLSARLPQLPPGMPPVVAVPIHSPVARPRGTGPQRRPLRSFCSTATPIPLSRPRRYGGCTD